MLQDVADRSTSPTNYEGFAPLQKRRLPEHVGRLFTEQRGGSVGPVAPVLVHALTRVEQSRFVYPV